MYKLLKFEFRRLFLRVSLYICLGVIAVPVLSMFYITGSDYFSKDYNYQITLFGVLQNMIRVANLTTLSVVFTSIFGCEDKARGTIKTIYSLGFPRFKLFLSKFLASATGEAQEEPNIILFIIQQFFVIMGAHAFYYMISELIGKTGLAIVLSIFGPGLVSSFFGIITAIISSVAYKNEKLIAAFTTARLAARERNKAWKEARQNAVEVEERVNNVKSEIDEINKRLPQIVEDTKKVFRTAWTTMKPY